MICGEVYRKDIRNIFLVVTEQINLKRSSQMSINIAFVSFI